MLKSLSRSPAAPWLGGTAIWAYMSILSHTLRWRMEGEEHVRPLWEGPSPFVIASWHSGLLLMPVLQIRLRRRWAPPPLPLSLMVSNSRDGEFTRRAALFLGLRVIRGSAASRTKSKDKRGVAAAREAMQAMLQGGGLCVTIDGPKGPPEIAGVGAVKLAQQMNAPIIPFGVSAAGPRLGTWDSMHAPPPFARAAVVFGPPVPASKSVPSEALRLEVEARLRAASRRAADLAGAAPPAHTIAAAPTRGDDQPEPGRP